MITYQAGFGHRSSVRAWTDQNQRQRIGEKRLDSFLSGKLCIKLKLSIESSPEKDKPIIVRYFNQQNLLKHDCLKLHGRIVWCVYLFVHGSRARFKVHHQIMNEEKEHQKIMEQFVRCSLSLSAQMVSWSFRSNCNVSLLWREVKKLKQINCVMGFVIFSLFKLLIFCFDSSNRVWRKSGNESEVSFWLDPFR